MTIKKSGVSSNNPLYDNLQRIFCLSYLSNISAFSSGAWEDIQEFTTNGIKFILEKAHNLIGQWELVWGPSVYQVPNKPGPEEKHKADNTMYVVMNDDLSGYPQYIIAIAGSMSLYDYLVEDFKVKNTYDWPYYNENPPGLKPWISEGTHIGLEILTENEQMKSNGQSIYDFLKDLMQAHRKKVEIVVTGHSLGGALSAALALYLADRKDEWDPERYAVLSAYPTAGPPIGNYDFVTYFESRIGCSTTRIWNRIDLVPHLWNMLDEALCLYFPEVPPGPWVQMLMGVLRALPGNNIYAQIKPHTPGLPGHVVDVFNLGLERPDPKTVEEKVINFFNFFAQAEYQHVLSYPSLLGLYDFVDMLKKNKFFVPSFLSLQDEKFIALCRKLSDYEERISQV
jgi:pimeloyl-ACP methyl ester carboxylesterase